MEVLTGDCNGMNNYVTTTFFLWSLPFAPHILYLAMTESPFQKIVFEKPWYLDLDIACFHCFLSRARLYLSCK